MSLKQPSQPPPELLSFKKLAKLDISGCDLVSLSCLKGLSQLEELRLTDCQALTFQNLQFTFKHLTLLDVTGCKNLRELPRLPALDKLLAAGSGLSNKDSLRKVLEVHSI